MRVGEFEILPVVDGTAYIPISEPFLNMPEEAWLAHREFLTSNLEVELALGAFLIRGGNHTVLVDTGVGRGGGPFRGGELVHSLAAHGVGPDDITDVIFTHLHFDHVGWATHDDKPFFVNATYRCDERDWAHFVRPEDPRAHKKLSPLTERMTFWDRGGNLLPGIDTIITPGHTPGSTVFVVSSGVERAILLGDVVHCPIEMLEDEWNGLGDVDPELAKRTRNQLLRELEGTEVPMAAAHFPGLQFGRMLGAQGKRSWVVP